MSNLSPFKFQESVEIRTMTQDNGEVLFVGKDVCKALGYSNHNDAMNDHCKGVAKRYPLQTAGGKQEVRVLTEADVLRLIVNSTLPAAEAFERWVFEEVLPSIRKTGAYAVQKPQNLPLPNLKPVEPDALPTSLLEEINRFAQDQAFDWYAQNESLKQQVADLTKHKDTLQTTCHQLLKLAHRMTYDLRGAKHLATTEEPEKIGTKYINYDDILELMRDKFFSYESDDKWLRKLPVRCEVVNGLLRHENAQRLRQMYGMTQEELTQLENVVHNVRCLHQDWARQKWALDAYLALELGQPLPEAPDNITKDKYDRVQFLLQEIDPALMSGANKVIADIRRAKERIQRLAAEGKLFALPEPLKY